MTRPTKPTDQNVPYPSSAKEPSANANPPPPHTPEELDRRIELIQGYARRIDRLYGNASHKAEHAANGLANALRETIGDRLASAFESSTPPHGTALEEFRGLLSHEGDWGFFTGPSATSVCDVFMKLAWLLPKISTRAYFRGQVDINWRLRPSVTRHYPDAGKDTEPGHVSDSELNALSQFQASFLSGQTWAHADDVRRFANIPRDSSAWWPLMQHYSEGTRLLDVCTSPLEGLYFACVNWDGTINEGTDGVLYAMPENSGRLMLDDPIGDDVQVVDSTPPLAQDMFKLDRPRILRFYRGTRQLNNERLKAQRGAFALWPDCFQDPATQVFYVAIDRGSKRKIASELLRFGLNPRVIVDGPEGRLAYHRVCKQLNVEPVDHD